MHFQDGTVVIFERAVHSPDAQDLKSYVEEVYNKVNLELVRDVAEEAKV